MLSTAFNVVKGCVKGVGMVACATGYLACCLVAAVASPRNLPYYVAADLANRNQQSPPPPPPPPSE